MASPRLGLVLEVNLFELSGMLNQCSLQMPKLNFILVDLPLCTKIPYICPLKDCSSFIAEHLSTRQLILHRISSSVCLFVSMCLCRTSGMQSTLTNALARHGACKRMSPPSPTNTSLVHSSLQHAYTCTYSMPLTLELNMLLSCTISTQAPVYSQHTHARGTL